MSTTDDLIYVGALCQDKGTTRDREAFRRLKEIVEKAEEMSTKIVGHPHIGSVAIAKKDIFFCNNTKHLKLEAYEVEPEGLSYFCVCEKDYIFLPEGYKRVTEGNCEVGDIAIGTITMEVYSTANLVHKSIQSCEDLNWHIYRKGS